MKKPKKAREWWLVLDDEGRCYMEDSPEDVDDRRELIDEQVACVDQVIHVREVPPKKPKGKRT